MTTHSAQAESKTNSKPRYDWVDAIKGVGIILVVLGHAVRGVHDAGLMSDRLFAALDVRIYAFHMPLFFFVSGFFFLASLERHPTGKFLKTRVTQLFYPMVLWTYLFLLFKAAAGSLSNNPIGLSDVLVSPVPGKLHFWFLWALILQQLLLLLIHRSLSTASKRVWLSVMVLVMVVAPFIRVPVEVAYYTGPAQQYGVYLIAGCVLFPLLQRLQMTPTATASAGLVFLGLLFSTPQLLDLGTLKPVIASLLSLSLTLALRGLFEHRGSTLIPRLGVASLAIYVSHTIFSAGIREVMRLIGIDDVSVHLVMGTLVGLFFPFALYLHAQRYNWARWVGWR